MIEVAAQTLIVKSVKKHGGYAFKLANRFLIGVPDLLIQLPGLIGALTEVKMNHWPVLAKYVKLGISPQQAVSLRSWEEAGGVSLVISMCNDLKNRRMYMYTSTHKIVAYKDHSLEPYQVSRDAYEILPRQHREAAIVANIGRALSDHSKSNS